VSRTGYKREVVVFIVEGVAVDVMNALIFPKRAS